MKRYGNYSDRTQLRELHLLIDMAFVLMDETDYKEIANRTGLSVSTLKRVQSRRLTTKIRCSTLMRIVHAAGLLLQTDPQTGRYLISLAPEGKR